MIDDLALKTLLAVHARCSDHPACLVHAGIAVIYSEMLVLEVPVAEVQLKKRVWPGAARPDMKDWRAQLPAGLAYAQASAIKGVDAQGREYVQFDRLDGGLACYMQGDLYELLRDQLDNPSFRVMDAPGKEAQPLGIGIFVDDVLVGAVSPLLPPAVE